MACSASGQYHAAEVVEGAGQRRQVRLHCRILTSGSAAAIRAVMSTAGLSRTSPTSALNDSPEAGDPRIAEPAGGRHDLVGGVDGHMVVDGARDGGQPGQVGRSLDNEPRRVSLLQVRVTGETGGAGVTQALHRRPVRVVTRP